MTGVKHAYLIVAHANPFIVERLIRLLDDERNDIYIHVDKKAHDFNFEYLNSLPQKSNIYFTERVDVRWGHVSLVKAELILFKSAYEKEKYGYYHLISGADLPIKSQDYIHNFFAKHSGLEFIGFSNAQWDAQRVDKIHLFSRHMRVGEKQIIKRIARKIRLSFLKTQNAIGYSRTRGTTHKFVFGSEWVSVTSDFVRDLLKKEKWFLSFYKYSNCADEIYKQTFALNSPYKDKLYNTDDELKGCMRFMDWQRGRPYTFRVEDFDEIMASDSFFARKFEDSIDKDIVEKIYNYLAK
ncbi:beta-1,6-N-acetylglucosaminyltransferase [Dysgonomonas sp. ZJ279]|uniref:beta-1,6-N-acetylglucosaminyltransferase n=1 Tax=Dysgonomonas sp. ZJ279 TaxID=2709796 RepID=UPI0013EA203F|nr:beta-1,6-N-acetylglucosaminyltransferase [Dysgonomonas sp. ZJ279]